MRVHALLPAMIVILMLTTGCAAIVAGAGAGAGVYTYFKGELIRAYPQDANRSLEACLAALDKLKIRITEQSAAGITTTVKGKRADATPVTVRLTILAPRVTEVGVRSGVIGLWDKQVSELIHATIAKRLE